LFSVSAGAASALKPKLTVFDAAGQSIDFQVLRNDSGYCIVQLVGPAANARYYVEVSADPVAGGGATIGTYLLGVNYLNTPLAVDNLADSPLSAANWVGVESMQSSRAQVYHFLLALATDGSIPDVAVRMQIFDENNNIVLTLDCRDGQTVSADIYLNKGTYRARLVAASRSGTPISTTGYRLLGTSLSDPLDPVPIDPNDPTAPLPPALVVTPLDPTTPTLPPVDPTSNPWTPL